MASNCKEPSTEKAVALVERWAKPFGFEHFTRTVSLLDGPEVDQCWAMSNWNLPEEFVRFWFQPDGSLPARTLEFVVCHEYAHGLLLLTGSSVSEHDNWQTELVCNRIASLVVGTKVVGPNKWCATKHPDKYYGRPGERLIG